MIPAEHSATQYASLLRLAEENRGAIDGARMVAIRDVLQDGGATFRHSVLEGMAYSPDHRVVFVPSTSLILTSEIERCRLV